MSALCPHCGNELGGYLVLTADGHSFRSYSCQKHGDLPHVQDELQRSKNIFGRDGYHLVPESQVSSEA